MRIYSLFVLLLALGVYAESQGIRERIRLKNRDASTTVSEAQGIDVTLTLSTAAVRQVQQIVRAAGVIDKNRKVLTVTVPMPEATLIKVGQRARAIAPESKQSMFQARVTRVALQNGRAVAEVTLSGIGLAEVDRYVAEITVELGEFLSVPNEAIIEEGDRRVVYVYVEEQKGEYSKYTPREIEGGVQGELYTAIQKGLKEGDQVVTFGSFFIDADHKLKRADQATPSP
jgi:hypothetical protein